ncbi:twin-arginine translocase TatA/TatE family subunit [Cohnella faecalis]|uniref:Sec-independent protein translocase protein TatA n=1 Tax=Cohnella faecalis TaxID=2315694 RepID=A0A398CKV4_9BACL|nr:twin-arginine translocase TatA/TatE family subunit [Cohnella faecalis]RIE03015.1 twin-arginine translocase TatA/TatE family subunit [Cohnella faecalis]
MPLNLGWTGILLLALIALLFFGPSKLPQLGRAVGSTLREFRSGTKELIQSDDPAAQPKSESRE